MNLRDLVLYLSDSSFADSIEEQPAAPTLLLESKYPYCASDAQRTLEVLDRSAY